jgi:parallel beta-helix repeat protein
MHVRSWRRFGALLAGAALLPVLAASPAAAAGIVVNSKAMLTEDDGTCSLPEAIKAANTDTASGASSGECAAGAGADVITFSVTGTVYTTRLPDITGPVTINGNHAVTLNGQGASSFFLIQGNPVYLQGLVFTNGRASYGGALFIADGAVVHLDESTVSNSRAQQGGGIFVGSDGLLYIADTTISGNSATSTGGGIHVQAGGNGYLRRSTVSGNSSPSGAGAYVSGNGLLGTANTTFARNTASNTGGAAYVGPNGFLSLYNSTVALNAATTSIGGVYMDNLANADVQNAIVAGNSRGNVSAVGFGTTVSSIIGGSITGLLDPAGLQSNGGPTKTIKLLSTAAAAIDDGNQSVCDGPGTSVDQRGLSRGTPCDIGAVERDRNAPTATAPSAALRRGAKLSGSSMSVSIRWSGSDGAGSGVARYQLQQRVNGGSYSTVSSSLTGTSKTFTLANGSDYQFRVRAIDRDGNTGAFATSPVFKPRLAQNSSSSITYAGTWRTATSASYSGGSVRYATQSDDETATYSFTGSSVAFITTTSTTRGIVRVYIDGQSVGLLDLYSSSTAYRKALYAKSWATSGVHTIQIENYGSPARNRVDIDAFAVIK